MRTRPCSIGHTQCHGTRFRRAWRREFYTETEGVAREPLLDAAGWLAVDPQAAGGAGATHGNRNRRQGWPERLGEAAH